jgi:hypothetical protein
MCYSCGYFLATSFYIHRLRFIAEQNNCLQTQDMETEECHLEALKLEVGYLRRVQYNQGDILKP